MFANLSVMIVTYFAYITIGVGLTIWVARTLHVHGRVFLAKGCKGNEELVSSLGSATDGITNPTLNNITRNPIRIFS